jgi:hypothetical protein
VRAVRARCAPARWGSAGVGKLERPHGEAPGLASASPPPTTHPPPNVEAIRSGVQPGLTMVVGPPGTGKTDTAVQIMSVLYANCPGQRTLLITHSNQALNDLFTKVRRRIPPPSAARARTPASAASRAPARTPAALRAPRPAPAPTRPSPPCAPPSPPSQIAERDVPARYLLRLGMGERDLDVDVSGGRRGPQGPGGWGPCEGQEGAGGGIWQGPGRRSERGGGGGHHDPRCRPRISTPHPNRLRRTTSRAPAASTRCSRAACCCWPRSSASRAAWACPRRRARATRARRRVRGGGMGWKGRGERAGPALCARERAWARAACCPHPRTAASPASPAPPAPPVTSTAPPASPAPPAPPPGYFWLLHVLSRWEKYTAALAARPPSDAAAVSELFPFASFFANAPQPLFGGRDRDADMEVARGCWRHLRTLFQELEECRAFELLKGQGDRVNYLSTCQVLPGGRGGLCQDQQGPRRRRRVRQPGCGGAARAQRCGRLRERSGSPARALFPAPLPQAKVVAMTCTHAALKRREFLNLAFK